MCGLFLSNDEYCNQIATVDNNLSPARKNIVYTEEKNQALVVCSDQMLHSHVHRLVERTAEVTDTCFQNSPGRHTFSHTCLRNIIEKPPGNITFEIIQEKEMVTTHQITSLKNI